ncbi:hypothetical protein AGR3A_pa70017 [Agrobacterium tomkonis CFBP 6623]|uniref:Transposase n=1 Tax=Agrobacterium tomkonis CFBP 6623 TaxID=1183432 RepID=A0A1S7S9K5_9HYPH|nr:hypothetical protein AGR3A_pa70017 [Agrobacterium tomkonis CFBP 6623]
MKAVADTLGVSRSNLIERRKGRSKPRGSYHKAEDAELTHHSQAGRSKANLWLSADRRAPQSRKASRR